MNITVLINGITSKTALLLNLYRDMYMMAETEASFHHVGMSIIMADSGNKN